MCIFHTLYFYDICRKLKRRRIYICGMCGLSDISLFSIEVKGKVFFFFLYWNFDEGSIKWGKNTEGQVQNRFNGDKATYNIYNTYFKENLRFIGRVYSFYIIRI